MSKNGLTGEYDNSNVPDTVAFEAVTIERLECIRGDQNVDVDLVWTDVTEKARHFKLTGELLLTILLLLYDQARIIMGVEEEE